ncbi:flagellar M-ring protein [Steroidobacter agaridevorans]|uniref:Flagellar M-ring protein n=1 Tax=Steroidobacter agaridevorans TaxID=2695856 RepID=A0A829YPA1_9GAMM|nr:flagellar basal-body MS-ring/collar protein FliF [Steroidobacter agaridevorans]GFE84801.1 flagellar M-ring protein [Steroidobacter agaridevorans]GFE86302.1 flagellar M-ring protein [Steroidobacter agaridevorans]
MSAEAAALPSPAQQMAGLPETSTPAQPPRPSLIPPAFKPLVLLIGIAAAVAAGVGIVLWSKEPTYSLLYGNLGQQDAAQIAQALDTNGIPYKLEGTGAITVPADRVHDARLKLAGQGLPEGDGGFSVMSKDPGFGVSQFMEGARYQHALETELARTITNLQAVEGARVHLALPRQSAFVRDRRKPSASVFLQMKPGRRLESEQVTAIVNLVASSIPELESQQVTVVDQQGRLLSSPEGMNTEVAEREKQMEIARELEDRYTQRVQQLLAPLVGTDRVRAQVVADVEMSTTEEAREQYRPDSQIVRSEQLAEETSRNGSGPQGVPGALTNQPPQPGTALPPGANATPAAANGAPANANGAAGVAPPDNTSKQQTRNYEIDRTVAYTKLPAGRLKRLTVAVLVDNLRSTTEDGKVTETALTPEQIENMTKLVKDAIGFNEQRGDSVSVVNQSFRGETKPEDIVPDEIPLWEQPLMRDVAKLLVGLIALLVLVFSVLRPMLRSLLGVPPKADKKSKDKDGKQAQIQQVTPVPMAAVAGPAVAAAADGAAAPLDYDGQIAAARALVTQDPARVAQLVKTWVGDDE